MNMQTGKWIGGMRRESLRACRVLAGVLFLAAMPTRADLITITELNENNGNLYVEGESFTPSVNDGYAGPTPTNVYLTQFAVDTLAGYDPSTPVYLQIYSGFSTNGGPYGTPSGFLGSSTNSVVWPSGPANAIGTGTFLFNGLGLTYTHKYYALFSTSSNTPALTFRADVVDVSSPYAGGGLIVGNGSGPLEALGNTLPFAAVFDTVPEPTVAALVVWGLAGGLLLRRRSGR